MRRHGAALQHARQSQVETAPSQRTELIATVEANIDPFLALNRESVELVSEIRGAPQLSLGFTARLSQQNRDAYSIGVVLDRDLSPGMAWTLNAGLEIREAFGSLEEELGATFATEIAIALGEESLTDARGARLSLAARGSFMEDTDTQVQVQGKLTVPLAAGLEFPISVTWANRTDLIDESDLFGQIGFSMDTAVLLRALGR